MAEKSFSVVYDGPLLKGGAMPVRDLAPALLALGNMFTAASLIQFPNREPVALSIRATTDGSFDVDLLLTSKKVFDETVDIFSSNPVAALEGLVFSVISAKTGLFWLINQVRGRRVVTETPQPEPGWVMFTLDDETTLTVPADVAALYKTVSIRRDAKEVVEPLYREGIETVTFRVDAHPEMQIDETDLPAYDVADVDEEDTLLDVVQHMVLEIVSVTFTEGNSWGFYDGERKFTAPVEDTDFIARVDAGEPFSKGDTLRCAVRVIQWRADNRLRIQRRVVKVLEHQRGSTEEQSRLEDGPPADEG